MSLRRHASRALILATLLASPAFAQGAIGKSGDAAVDAQLDKLRSATKSFQNLDSAVAAGYPREVAECLVHEHHGAMGYHHVNRSYLAPTLDITKPQILLYEKKPDGSYKLNGMEFIIPYRMYPRDSVAPVFLGRKLAHEDNLNIWYLHVWAWTNNADGVFANFNPDVSCGTTGKVYTPFSKDAL